MAEVDQKSTWADVYKNIQQPDPMKQAGEVFSVGWRRRKGSYASS
jgi:hypothetical protein